MQVAAKINIHLDIDIHIICGLECDIKIIDTYHIFCQPFCKVLCVGLLCIKIVYLSSVSLKMYNQIKIFRF